MLIGPYPNTLTESDGNQVRGLLYHCVKRDRDGLTKIRIRIEHETDYN